MRHPARRARARQPIDGTTTQRSVAVRREVAYDICDTAEVLFRCRVLLQYIVYKAVRDGTVDRLAGHVCVSLFTGLYRRTARSAAAIVYDDTVSVNSD